MTLPTAPPRRRTRHLRTPLAAALVAAALASVPSAAQADIGTPVPLGAGATFVVLAEAGVTNTGATVLGGDVGSFATTSITGSETIVLQDGGVNRGGDLVTQQAKLDLVTAYNSASSQTPDPLAGVELAGLTLEPGVYDTGGVIELSGNLTLDANGDPDAVFIFQSTATLLAGSSSSITFVDGATACNLYWRVPSSAAILGGARFAGTILAEATIAFGAGATLTGRAMSMNGQVTLINNTITLPGCAPDDGGSDGGGDVVVTPGDSELTPQVPVTPRGGIATGDGSSIASTSSDGPALVALTLLGFAAVLLVAHRPRRLARG